MTDKSDTQQRLVADYNLAVSLNRVATAFVLGLDPTDAMAQLYRIAHEWVAIAARTKPDPRLITGLILLLGPGTRSSDEHLDSPDLALRGEVEALYRKWSCAALN